MGVIYLGKLKLEKALEYFEKANSIYKKRKDFRGIFLTTINLAIVYLWKDDVTNVYSLYALINDIFNNNIIEDVELTSAYYDFLAKVYGYVGIWDKALKNTKVSKELYEVFNMKEYQKAFMMEIYYKYSQKALIDKKDMDIFYNILKRYSTKSVSNEVLTIILKTCELSLLNKDVQFTHKLLHMYNNLKPIKELQGLKIIRVSIESNISNNEKLLDILEDTDIDKYSLGIRTTLNLNLGIKMFENKEYKKAIYFLLRSLANVLSSIEYFENLDLAKGFIKSRYGDLIKEYICDAIILEFNKGVNFTKIEDIKDRNIYTYFDISDITDILTEEEVDSIFYIYNQNNKIKDIEELLYSISDNYKHNLDNILQYISDETLAEKGFIILYDKKVNKYNVLSSLKTEDIKDFNLNKLIYLDRKREGILLNKNSLNKSRQDMVKALSKEYMGVVGVLVGIKTINPNIQTDRRKEKNVDERYKGYIYLETKNYINKFNHKTLKN